MTLWLKVTNDKYEFPVIIADSLSEMAEITGQSKNTISSIASKYNTNRGKGIYRRVKIDDDL